MVALSSDDVLCEKVACVPPLLRRRKCCGFERLLDFESQKLKKISNKIAREREAKEAKVKILGQK